MYTSLDIGYASVVERRIESRRMLCRPNETHGRNNMDLLYHQHASHPEGGNHHGTVKKVLSGEYEQAVLFFFNLQKTASQKDEDGLAARHALEGLLEVREQMFVGGGSSSTRRAVKHGPVNLVFGRPVSGNYTSNDGGWKTMDNRTYNREDLSARRVEGGDPLDHHEEGLRVEEEEEEDGSSSQEEEADQYERLVNQEQKVYRKFWLDEKGHCPLCKWLLAPGEACWEGNGPIRIFRSGFPHHLHTIYTSVTNYLQNRYMHTMFTRCTGCL